MRDQQKMALAVAIFTVGVVGYYFLDTIGAAAQWGGLLVGVLAGAGIYATTEQFNRFRTFVRESRIELNKVVWPSRQETVQTTAVVIAMVLFVAVFLWLVDWLIYSAVQTVMG
jgi:preprotein translocase subunit SecE